MPRSRMSKDLLDGYAWMRRVVLGLEDQSIKTTRRPAYGVNSIVPLSTRAGWHNGVSSESHAFARLCALSVADQTFILGSVKWNAGEDPRVVAMGVSVAPLEDYVFSTFHEDGTPVVVTASRDGFIRIPPGSSSIVNLRLQWPTPRDGG